MKQKTVLVLIAMFLGLTLLGAVAAVMWVNVELLKAYGTDPRIASLCGLGFAAVTVVLFYAWFRITYSPAFKRRVSSLLERFPA